MMQEWADRLDEWEKQGTTIYNHNNGNLNPIAN